MSKPYARRSSSEWQQIIDDHAESGLSAPQYCQQHGVGYASFSKWRQHFSGTKNPSDSMRVIRVRWKIAFFHRRQTNKTPTHPRRFLSIPLIKLADFSWKRGLSCQEPEVSYHDTPYYHCIFLCRFLCRECFVFVGRFCVERIQFLAKALNTAVAGLKSVWRFKPQVCKSSLKLF